MNNIEKYHKVILDTIELSSFSFDDNIVNDNEKVTESRNNLCDYLIKQDYEAIQVLYTLMNIGRDSSLEGENGEYNYVHIFNLLNSSKVQDDKELLIDQIISKVHLCKSLPKALKKINYTLS